MKKSTRRSVNILFAVLGIVIIITAVLMSAILTVKVQLPIVLLGVLLMEVGVRSLSGKYFLNERRYIGLRSEGDNIIKLIRELNSSAVARDNGEEDDRRFQSTLEKMHDSVDRMSRLASVDTSAPK